MFYVSKVSPYFFLLAIGELLLMVVIKPFDMSTAWKMGVFGFMAHAIMAAMYQIVPNSQNRSLAFPKLSYLVFALSLTFPVLLLSGQALYASVLHAITVSLFFVHVLLSVRNLQPITVRMLLLGSVYLFLGSLFFLLSEMHIVHQALAVHSMTVGFMMNVVFGVEYAWVPMLLMETVNIKQGRRLFYLSLLGVPIFLLSFYIGDYRLVAFSSLLVFAFAGYFLWLVAQIFLKRRMPREIPLVVKYFLLGLFYLPVGLFVGFLMAAKGLVGEMLVYHMDLLLFGFVGTTLMGGLAHLLPRMVYNMYQQKGVNLAISDLVDEELLKKLLPISPICVFVMLYLDTWEITRYVSGVPYVIVWLFFTRAVFYRSLKRA
ncbi:hypothetical protein [Thermocrinis minervae]|uniref:NnrS protein n=1 Tax=Thermocrinis minervae TaxID=381751 RepID=A0A1M6SY31_9AQUI|nr:hypothetical protein [Thermocrinis minervae]SHK49625.1 hypothetical protein SAMN05444391_1215 [Thermocrinis minervae]